MITMHRFELNHLVNICCAISVRSIDKKMEENVIA